MAGSRQLIENPLTFTPLPFGLLSVAVNAATTSHWAKGVNYQTNCTNSGSTTFDKCISVTGDPAPIPSTKEATTELGLRGATPFTVVTKFDCSPVGVDNAQKIATDALDRTSSWQVERAFWTGISDSQEVVFPHLAADSEVIDSQDEQDVLLQSIPVTGAFGPVDIARGLGFLEKELADCYGGQGVIHVSRNVLETMEAWDLVEARGPQLRTRNGNLVAVGSGYTGSAPDGSAPAEGNEWIYATGMVFAFSGPVKVFGLKESFNRAENTVEMIAERTYLLGWDCCHVGVEIITGVPIPPVV